MTDIERMVFETIAEIQGSKRESGRFPDYAMMEEVLNSLRPKLGPRFDSLKEEAVGALRKLCREKRIEYHLTINKLLMFGIKN